MGWWFTTFNYYHTHKIVSLKYPKLILSLLTGRDNQSNPCTSVKLFQESTVYKCFENSSGCTNSCAQRNSRARVSNALAPLTDVQGTCKLSFFNNKIKLFSVHTIFYIRMLFITRKRVNNIIWFCKIIIYCRGKEVCVYTHVAHGQCAAKEIRVTTTKSHYLRRKDWMLAAAMEQLWNCFYPALPGIKFIAHCLQIWPNDNIYAYH